MSVYIMSISNSIVYSLNENPPPELLLSITMLLFHLRIISFLKTKKYFGRYLAIIINVAKYSFSFIIILILVVLAFTDAFWILFQNLDENYENSFKNYNTSINALFRIIIGMYY